MSYRYSGIHLVTQLMWKNTRKCSLRLHNVYMTGKLTRCVTCKVYWNTHVPHFRAQQKMMQSNFLQNIYSEQVLTPYSQGAQEISFKLHLFETPWRLMGKRTNSNVHNTVTNWPFAVQIIDVCLILKKKNPYCTATDSLLWCHCSGHEVCIARRWWHSSSPLRVPYQQKIILLIICFYAIMHRTTIVQNKIISIICSCFFFVRLIFIGLV